MADSSIKAENLEVVGNNHDVSISNNYCEVTNSDDVTADESNHVTMATPSCDDNDVINSVRDSNEPCDDVTNHVTSSRDVGTTRFVGSSDISVSGSVMQKSSKANASSLPSVDRSEVAVEVTSSQDDSGVALDAEATLCDVTSSTPANVVAMDSEMLDVTTNNKPLTNDTVHHPVNSGAASSISVPPPEGSDQNHHHSDSSTTSSRSSKDMFMDAQEDLSNEAAGDVIRKGKDAVDSRLLKANDSGIDVGKSSLVDHSENSTDSRGRGTDRERMQQQIEEFYQSLSHISDEDSGSSDRQAAGTSKGKKPDEPSTSCEAVPELDTSSDAGNAASYDVTRRSDSDSDDVHRVMIRSRKRVRARNRASSSSSSSTTEGPDEQAENEDTARKSSSESEAEDEMETENARVPSAKWHPLLATRKREVGYSNTVPLSYMFARKTNCSLSLVQRLKLQYKLEYHEGCVNALHFNKSGTLLASGSDDMNIVLWRWDHNKPYIVFESGHRSNVFQAKFMPYTGDTHIVSCARDGMVRLAELSSTGICKGTRKLAQHKGAAHKLAIQQDASHLFYSCGEDAVTYEVDLRQDKPNKLCTTRNDDRKVALYSIHANPFKSHEFVVGGRDHYVRVYDKRMLDENEGKPVKRFCPSHLVNSEHKANVTCAVYNYNGSEILGTYNDEDIYLFDSSHSDGADFIKRYKGHRNNATVKGVNFYGPHSEYVISGSDCGNVFLWDKDTEKVVQYFHGDEGGVINVLEPHPHFPILATSGLDHDVKVWVPNANEPTHLDGLNEVMRRNRKERREEQLQEPEMLDGQMLWLLMQHLRRSSRRNARRVGEEVSTSSSNSDDNDDPDPDDDHPLPDGDGDGPPVSCVQS